MLKTGTSIYDRNIKDELGAVIAHGERDRRELEEWAAANRAAWAEDHARDFSAGRRKKAAKEGAALPDGSFPIYSQEDVNNAAGLAGKGKAAKSTVHAHIRKRVKALGLKMPPSVAASAKS